MGLFASLGWHTASANVETFGPEGTLGRETKGEVVLVTRLRAGYWTLPMQNNSSVLQKRDPRKLLQCSGLAFLQFLCCMDTAE